MNNSKLWLLYLFAMAMVVTTEVFAQKQSGSKEKVVYEKNTRIDFEEKEVDGKFMSPDGKGVNSERRLEFDSLLDPKNSFSKELKRDSGAVR
jgi:hypothetical protein